ncbi:Protein-lysine methyltransferase METTL21B [Heracleum sosnowskyi]|uniref:Protein-lysine methyltransferase METTL21B n=1 Tax=Heracleum sosnowskyi TaxID=360622 RepID=A0AAD8HX00_9APIA|nr:Protein-lysine methyltransferase METTL21B [Heracleum sosnowskyi]
MNVTGIQEETESEVDQEINPCAMLLVEQDIEDTAAKDELLVNLHSVKSNVVIRQLPSQGISFKLWPAATTLVSLLDNHNNTAFSSLFDPTSSSPLRILELGSGTGIVGIAAAAILGAHVMLTDLAHAIPNLKFNAEANSKMIGVNGGKVEVTAMAWGEEKQMEHVKGKEEFDIVMGSDLVYHDHLYDPLLRTLRFFLLGDQVNKDRVFVMAHSKRWKKESVFFKKANKDFHVEVIHRDDPRNGDRVGILVCTFIAKNNKKKKVEGANDNQSN